MTEFFMPMIPPTITAQEKRISTRGRQPIVYEDDRLRDARAKLKAHLAGHRPAMPFNGPVALICVWQWPPAKAEMDGRYKTTRPDTDNLMKMLKDVMTDVGFWKDDALICDERCIKKWGRPGIYIAISELSEGLIAHGGAEG